MSARAKRPVRYLITIATLAGAAATGLAGSNSDAAAGPTPKEVLGGLLFADRNLSINRTESCASCHAPKRAFTGNNHSDPLFPVAIGATPNLIGGRNTPTAMYAAFSPAFGFVDDGGEWIPQGGQFWDGRADSLEQQAGGPFLNPREMAMTSKAAVIGRIAAAPYAALFRQVYGQQSLKQVDSAYTSMTEAIAAFERTAVFAPFSSKFDAVLRGKARFTRDEAAGFALFKDPEKGNCIACHAGVETSTNPRDWLFTDFTYDNLGVPRNEQIPDNADPEHFDLGLCDQAGIEDRVPADVADPAALVDSLCGAFKVPTLRNVARTAPYMHNGVFTSLRDVVEFYVTRDTNPARWYPTVGGVVNKFNDLPPEYQGNVNTSEAPYDRQPGEAPRLTSAEIDQVVKFLGTLSDTL